MLNKRYISLATAILLILIYFPLFLNLDNLPIQIWDESRLANNAYEMYKNGDYLTVHFNGSPDLWNTKPPLMIWLQAGLSHLLGYGPLSIRLPSAIAGLLTCLFLLWFSSKFLKEYWLGFISVLVLITSYGYIDSHATRTGDYDALLVLFVTIASFFFFIAVERIDEKKGKYLFWFFVSLSLAALTKGVAAMLFAPAWFLYVLFKGKLLRLLKKKAFYLNLAMFLFIVFGYYFLRELANPGYFEVVQENELGGRYLSTLENHKHDFWFYFDGFIDKRFLPWYLLLLPGILIGFFSKNNLIRNLTSYLTLLGVIFFLVISFGQTKLKWYDLPLYPIIAMLVSVLLLWLIKSLRGIKAFSEQVNVNVIPVIVLFLFFVNPYSLIFDKISHPKLEAWPKNFYDTNRYLRYGVKGKRNFNNYKVCHNGYRADLMFYQNQLKERGQNISFVGYKDIEPLDHIIAQQKEVQDSIERHFSYHVQERLKSVTVYHIDYRCSM